MIVERPCLQSLEMRDLIEGARQETAQFLRKLPTDGSYAFELFRRALVLRDNAAWVGLYGLYASLVKSWVLRRAATHFIDDVESLVNAVFAKFANAVNARNWQHFRDTRALLAYLRCCASSVVADDWRSRQCRSREDPLDAVEQTLFLDDPAEIVVGQLAAREFWRIVSSAVTSPEERLVLQVVLLQCEPPRDLQRCYPALFPTVDDVYRVKRNLLERLRRDHAVLAFAQGRHERRKKKP